MNLVAKEICKEELNDRLRAYHLGMPYDAFVKRRDLLRNQSKQLKELQEIGELKDTR